MFDFCATFCSTFCATLASGERLECHANAKINGLTGTSRSATAIIFISVVLPREVAAFDERGEHIRISLKTDDLAAARAKRDIYEAADNDYWSSLILGFDGAKAKLQYSAAVKRARS